MIIGNSVGDDRAVRLSKIWSEFCSSEKGGLLEQMRQERDDAERQLREFELMKASEVKKVYEQMRKERETALLELEERMQAERQRDKFKLEQKHAEETQV